jgi:hypothetical protein
MTLSCFRSCRCYWPHLFRMLSCIAVFCISSASSRAQSINFEKPLQTINDDVTAFAFAPNGNMVFSVAQIIKTKKFVFQRDDIWLQEAGGHRRRLLEGNKLVYSNPLFSYSVEAFHWGPDGHTILAEIYLSLATEDNANTTDSRVVLIIEDSGKIIKLPDTKDIFFEASNAGWLADSSTIAYLSEVVQPHVLFSMFALRYSDGRPRKVFEGRTFLAAAWIPRTNTCIAVERDRNMDGPPRLQRLDLALDNDKELATLDDYTQGLSVSPGGNLVAYYIDNEVLEIRDLTSPSRVARIRIGLGAYQWMPDGRRIMLKRALEKKSGDIVLIDIPPLVTIATGKEISVSQPTPTPLLHNLNFRDFEISPDGRFLGLVAPGKHYLQVFPLPR